MEAITQLLMLWRLQSSNGSIWSIAERKCLAICEVPPVCCKLRTIGTLCTCLAVTGDT